MALDIDKPNTIERPPETGRMTDLVEEFWDLPLIDALYQHGLRASPDDFRDALHQLFGRRGQLLLTGSARQALRVVLARVAAESQKRRVLVSSFNCRVVKEAVHSAGLAVDTFDFATPNGRIEWDAVAQSLTDEHLAIVVPHFFGIPTDFTAVLPAARRRGVMIVEDCAHTLGASIAGTPAGLLGDAALLSFNYDKPISLAGGGALLINHPAITIDRQVVEAPPPGKVELQQFRRMAARLLGGRMRCTRRSLAARMLTKLRVPGYAPPRVPTGIGSLRAAVGMWQLERYDVIRQRRDHNAQFLNEALGHLSWHVAETVGAAHLKLRVVVSPADAAFAVRQCRLQRIAIANSNWPKLIEPDGTESARVNAQRAATFGLDVPVHQNLSHTDLHNIASAFAHAKAPDWEMLP